MLRSYLEGIALPTGQQTRVDEVRIGDETTIGIYPNQRNAQPLAIDFLQAPNFANDMRIGQSGVAASPVDPLTTVIVLGKQYKSVAWVDLFFQPTAPLQSASTGLATSKSFMYPIWGTDHLQHFDTELPEGAPYGFSGLNVAWIPGEIEVHGWAAMVTIEEASRAQGSLNWVSRKAALPMFIVNRAMQFKAAEMLLDTTADATFAVGHVMNKTPGTEWDQPGIDMRADINAGITAILSKVTAERDSVTLVLSNSSYDSALLNEGYRDWHSGVILTDASNKAVNEARLAQFLGIGEVRIINPTGEAGNALFDDVAWLIVRDSSGADFEADYGSEKFAARFALNDGIAMESWTEEMIRAQLYPTLKEYKLDVLNPNAGYLITNTSSQT